MHFSATSKRVPERPLMMNLQSFYRRYRRQKCFELFIAIAVIVSFNALAFISYRPLMKKATILHAVGAFDATRRNALYHFAHHGEWPAGPGQAPTDGWPVHNPISDDKFMPILQSVQMDQGAITTFFGEAIPGRRLTMRPAHSQGNPYGLVIWVAGAHTRGSDWMIYGEDRTNVAMALIPKSLR